MQTPETTYETGGGSSAETLVSRTEQYTRDEPLKAVATAFAAGLVLTILPVGTILGALIRLVFTLLRPALFVLGAVKLYEEVEKRQHQ